MSLYIYDRNDNLSFEVVKCNDSHFKINSSIPNDEVVTRELREIEHAERVSKYRFIGRVKDYGAMYSDNLSTGTKTFLNIYKEPQICFDVCECGSNVLEFILKNIRDGKIYWDTPALVTTDDECDIIYKDRKFNSVHDFINYAVNGDDDDEFMY